MSIFVVLAVLIVIAVGAILAMKMKGLHALSTLPYERKTLFSAAERSFLSVFDRAIPTDYRVFGKVRIADVAEVRRGLSKSERQRALNKVSAKHLDFLLCDAKDLAPICAIELDDRSHSKTSRQTRDDFVEDVLKAINLPLLRAHAKNEYSIQEIRQEIERVTARKIAEVAPSKEEAAQTQPVLTSAETKIEDSQVNSSDVKHCPKCGATMVLRKANKGPNAGQLFWGCSAYPACRAVIKAASRPSA